MIYSNNSDLDLVDFIDSVNNVLSVDFNDKWRHKYSSKFVKIFQQKIYKTLTDKRPLKIDSLFLYLTNKHKYGEVVVKNFFKDIEIEIYSPLIKGDFSRFI